MTRIENYKARRVLLQELKGRKAGTMPDIASDAIQLMIEIIESKNE
jgi:hypothetical protein